ncbi:unnamed protein product, partial [Mesorhabditis belari]|uniref:3-hydroxy-3-methylglutaryl coenzyme A reductase n=1 Tax=Mesorhabditis belari TaxID=2138241 RepID=A0AAF3EGR6_9BILA
MIGSPDIGGFPIELQSSTDCSKPASNRRPSFSDSKMKKSPQSGSQSIKNLRKVLDEIDVNKDGWKEKIIDFVYDEFSVQNEERNMCETRETTSKMFYFGNGSDSESGPSTPTQESCPSLLDIAPTQDRTIDDLTKDLKEERPLRDGDFLRLLNRGVIKSRELEEKVKEKERAVAIRREFVAPKLLNNLPYKGYNYDMVMNSCCENVIGFMPIPMGTAGPLKINCRNVFVPMATTEGALIASTNRGCSAIFKAGGVTSRVFDDKMTRAPVVQMRCLDDCLKLKSWISIEENFQKIKKEFDQTSRFANLLKIETTIDGSILFIKFFAKTGDAMGMNMVSKGCSSAMKYLKDQFPEMKVLSLSGNLCVDKKAAAINWIQGRGKSVAAECSFSDKLVSSIFRTTPRDLVEAANAKLNVGSSRAGTLGGQNCHAANIVAAIFLATGQDAAQVVSSSMCSTKIEVDDKDGDLKVSCTMPVMEVGTVGGGTILGPQRDCLKMLECEGPNETSPGANAARLAEVICGAVLAGEISLLASLTTDELVDSHMKLNRSRMNLYSSPSSLMVPNTQSKDQRNPPIPTSPNQIRQKRNSESMRPGCANIL